MISAIRHVSRSRPVCLAMALALTTLSGCIGGAGIEREASFIDPASVDMGAAVRSAVSDAGWPTQQWWDQWGDPQLDQLMKRAVSGSPTLAIVKSRVSAAIWEARALHANQLPDVESSLDLARTRFARFANPVPPGGSNVWNNAAALDLSYDLDLWGKYRSIEQGALNNVHAAVADAQFAKIELQSAVARTYNQLALQYALLDIYESINEEQKRNVDIVAKRRAAGLVNAVDVSEARTQYEAGVADVTRTRNAIALARLEIAYLVGEGPGFGDSLSRPHPPGQYDAELPTSLPAELIGHRPDVVAQRWRASAAAKTVDAVHADFYPDIDLVANASLASLVPFGGFFNFINSDAVGHSVGFAASLPIFDADRRRGHYGVAMSEYDDAILKYNDTVLSAMQSVAQQVTSLRSLKSQEVSVRNAVLASQSAYELAKSGYQGGITEYLDVLVTQKLMLQQQLGLAMIQANIVEQWILLVKDLGGGYEVETARSNAAPGGDDAR